MALFPSCTSGRGPDQAKGQNSLKPFAIGFPFFQRGSFGQWYSRVSDGKPFPSGNDVSPIDWVHGAVRGDCSQTQHESFFPLPVVFLVSTNSLQRFWGLVVWMLRIGTASHPGPGLRVELINVGGWLANCDEALETEADFLVVTEHRLVPARTRSESKRLKTAGIFSRWTPACQESAHVGHAGVGLVGLKGAPLFHAVPSTHDFRVWVGLGRVLRSVVPVGRGCVFHVVVVCGFQGADSDPEKLARIEQLFQAVLCELRVGGDGHPHLLLGDFNIEPSKIPCLAKGISEGLLVDFAEKFSASRGNLPARTCKNVWDSEPGGILFLVILLFLLLVLVVGLMRIVGLGPTFLSGPVWMLDGGLLM